MGLQKLFKNNAIKAMKNNITYVTTPQISCDGGINYGHPKVYLDLAKTGQATCPYCSRIFMCKGMSTAPCNIQKNNRLAKAAS